METTAQYSPQRAGEGDSTGTHAFTRGSEGAASAPPPLRSERGYMTAGGADRLRQRMQDLIQRRARLLDRDDTDLHSRTELATVEREIAQASSVLQGAIVIRHAAPPRDQVRFGATVELQDERGGRSRFQLVGELEAAPEQRRISWFSPLGRALAGAHLGDHVEWSTPSGRSRLQVMEIDYDDGSGRGDGTE